MAKDTLASIKRQRAKRIANLAARAWYLHRKKRDAEMYDLICSEFVALGGVYVKFLQGGLLHSKAISKWRSPGRFNVFENLDSEPVNIVRLLQHELPDDRLRQIQGVQPEPFAAGSFGQVYYGQHINGKPIIIKVLRPMVRELLQFDLKLLSAFSKKFLAKLYKNMDLQLDQAIRDFRHATLRETDYIHEAAFAAELHRSYKDHPSIVIPETFTDLCTRNIIVQEYIGGISIAQLLKLKEQGVDPTSYVKEQLGSDLDSQLESYGYESIMDIFRLERVQGDPHPGNIRLLPDNKIGAIDFGISATVPKEKAAFFGLLESYDKIFKGSQSALDLFEHSLRFFVGDLYRSLKKLGGAMSRDQTGDYVKEVSRIAHEAFVQATGSDIVNTDFSQDQSLLVLVNKVVNNGNRFGLVMKLEATEILRAVQTYTTLISRLGRYEQVVPKIMHHAVNDIRQSYPEVTAKYEDNIGMGEAIEVITRWLERVANRDPALFQQLMHRLRASQQPVAEATESS